MAAMSARSVGRLPRLGVVVLLLTVSAVGADAATETEIAEQLERWLEDPLDLGTATAADLSLLPWIDTIQAAAIVGLRQAGGLTRLHDLLQVPELDSVSLAAIEPFVTLPAARGAPGWQRLRVGARSRSGGQMIPHARWSGGQGNWSAQINLRSESLSGGRMWAAWRGSGHAVLVGDLRPRVGWGLLDEDPRSRSRSAPLSIAHRMDLSPYASVTLPSMWRGVGWSARFGRLATLAAGGRGPRATRAMAAAELHSPEPDVRLRLGAAVRVERTSRVFGAWMGGSTDPLDWRVEAARPMGGSSRLAAGVRMHGPAGRVGLGWVADRVGGGGTDPVSGLRLDRPHRSLQMDAARRGSGVVATLLVRRLWRGAPGDATVRDRAEAGIEGRASWGAWTLRLRGDRTADPDGSEVVTFRATWGERGLGRRRTLRLRQVWDARGSTSLLAGGLEADRPLRWRLAVAGVTGQRSLPWSPSLPGSGTLGPWLAPGSIGLAAGVAFPLESRTVFSAWLGTEMAGTASPDPFYGFRLEAER
jgi:hypothetical protein